MGRQCESAVRAQVKVRRHRVQVFYVKNCATIPKIGKRRRVGGWMGGWWAASWWASGDGGQKKALLRAEARRAWNLRLWGGLCDGVDGDGVERCDHRFGLV